MHKGTDLVQQVLMTPTGVVVHTPGVPPMYDYEFNPQLVRFLIPESESEHLMT